jgi:hypothetical protein
MIGDLRIPVPHPVLTFALAANFTMHSTNITIAQSKTPFPARALRHVTQLHPAGRKKAIADLANAMLQLRKNRRESTGAFQLPVQSPPEAGLGHIAAKRPQPIFPAARKLQPYRHIAGGRRRS